MITKTGGNITCNMSDERTVLFIWRMKEIYTKSGLILIANNIAIGKGKVSSSSVYVQKCLFMRTWACVTYRSCLDHLLRLDIHLHHHNLCYPLLRHCPARPRAPSDPVLEISPGSPGQQSNIRLMTHCFMCSIIMPKEEKMSSVDGIQKRGRLASHLIERASQLNFVVLSSDNYCMLNTLK